MRPGTVLGQRGRIGTFVETKNAEIGAGSRVPHFSYVGDAYLGEGAYVGAGTTFANFDGQHRLPTHVGDHVFVGANSVLVAPIEIGDGAYVAAGSAITSDVPPGALAVARGREHVSSGWVRRKRPGSRAAAAAEDATGEVHPRIAEARVRVQQTNEQQEAQQ